MTIVIYPSLYPHLLSVFFIFIFIALEDEDDKDGEGRKSIINKLNLRRTSQSDTFHRGFLEVLVLFVLYYGQSFRRHVYHLLKPLLPVFHRGYLSWSNKDTTSVIDL